MILDWKNLAFQYLPTNGYVQLDYANGSWGEIQEKTEPYITMHIAASSLHYGQECFEGLKAFATRDGKVSLFRPDENARRLRLSADRICMEAPSEELFLAACMRAVQMNAEFIPPYGTGASLYVRPVLFGTEATIGIKASDSYTFIVLVTPVGPYYKSGFCPVKAVVMENFDRAAPFGTGQAKVGGNYAASLKPAKLAKKMGYAVELFTDPRENKYVDEFGTSNFIGITADGHYKTPTSSSILGSITNKSLQALAVDMGLKVKSEPIAIDSIDQFVEVGACGTAAVITPVYQIDYRDRSFSYGTPAAAGPVLTQLYQELQGIQYGDIADRHGWLKQVEVDSSLLARA